MNKLNQRNLKIVLGLISIVLVFLLLTNFGYFSFRTSLMRIVGDPISGNLCTEKFANLGGLHSIICAFLFLGGRSNSLIISLLGLFNYSGLILVILWIAIVYRLSQKIIK